MSVEILRNLKDHSLLIANNHDKLQILNYLSQNSYFLNLDFFDSLKSLSKFSKNYPFFLKERFNKEPYLSDRFKKYFDYIKTDSTYDNLKIEELRKIKIELIKNKILLVKPLKYQEIFSVNDAYVPKFFDQDVRKIYTNKAIENPVYLYRALNQYQQIMCVYEKVVELLEKGISTSKINIINSYVEDDISLTKLFKDAQIPYNLFKRQALAEYPVLIKVIDILKNAGYQQAKTYLASLKESDIVKKIVKVFNDYDSNLIANNLPVFIHELKKLTFVEVGYQSAVSITGFNDLVYKDDEYYLLMNYYEESFPIKYLDNDYLSDLEAKLIDYPSSLELNHYQRMAITSRLNQIDHLFLIYPKKIIEDTIPSRLDLSREVVVSDYEYQVKDKSYLSELLFLDFAKKKFDYENYNLFNEDLTRLNNLFGDRFREYIPQFNGIEDKTLSHLLKNNNTLSAYKLETYNLCPFRYYLSYLLKLDSFQGNIFTYIGQVIHKVIETKAKQNNYDIDLILSQFAFPEDELYKYPLFKELIVENIQLIDQIVSEFEEVTQFKTVKSEEIIKQEFNDKFTLSGVIDKVMIDEEYRYFLIIDYKYGDENYNQGDLEKDYDLQLPFYLYAFQRQNPDLKPAGILYQQTSLKKDQRGKEANYKMKGLVIDLVSVLKRIDPTLSKIQGVRVNKDGSLPQNSRSFISRDGFDELIKNTEKVVSGVSQRIAAGDFVIKPILIDIDQRTKDSISCKYCKFFGICYSKNKLLGGE